MASTEEVTLKRKHDELVEDMENGKKSGNEVEKEHSKKLQKTSSLDVAETPYGASLGTDLVEIRVGPEEKSFWLSKKLFKGKLCPLPEECPKAFDILVEWVYTGKFRPLRSVSSDENGKALKLNYNPEAVYILLEQYCLLELLDPFMDMMRKELAAKHVHPIGIGALKHVYSKSSDGSPLRKFVAQSVYYALVKYKSNLGGFHETYKMQSKLVEVDGLLLDVLDLMRGQSGKRHAILALARIATFTGMERMSLAQSGRSTYLKIPTLQSTIFRLVATKSTHVRRNLHHS